MYDITTINDLIAKLEAKAKRQQTNLSQTTMEIDHWRKLRADLDKKAGK